MWIGLGVDGRGGAGGVAGPLLGLGIVVRMRDEDGDDAEDDEDGAKMFLSGSALVYSRAFCRGLTASHEGFSS